jgi:hypothetical protein
MKAACVAVQISNYAHNFELITLKIIRNFELNYIYVTYKEINYKFK